MGKTLIVLLVSLFMVFSSVGAWAAIEDFSYNTHTNSTSYTSAPNYPGYEIYADTPTNSEVVATWDLQSAATAGSAGIEDNSTERYAFGSVNGVNPGQTDLVAVMDVGTQVWGIADGVLAAYLGPNGRDLHGGFMAVRALLSGFTGQIELGFVSDREVNYGDGPELDEFGGTIFDMTDSFADYQGMDLNDYTSYFDDEPYGDLSGVKVLGIWITLISDTTDASINGQLQVDKIELTPEPATVALLVLGSVATLWGRFRRN